jgi:hypothetical protein
MTGYTAIKYFQQVPQKVKIGTDEYQFGVKANICMAWVKDEHVEAVLNITRVCCGGNKTHPYRVANDTDIRRWSGTSER